MVKKNSEKITIFGSQGELGNYLVKKFCNKYEVIAPNFTFSNPLISSIRFGNLDLV